ncbi:MAG: sigma-54 dependent transcriptional regulator [Candidatus Tritonobacter lacicola]|nr:sigma-54 dependent transcriptional regulator [Candidatus Tritonobacter lacicola]
MVKRRNNSGLMPNSSRGFDCRRILVDMNVPCGLSDLMNMMGESEEMLRLYELVGKVAATDCTILIQGDSGTGKQLIAQAIHYMGRRRGKRFIHVSCGALPPTLIENEFFGHDKGAYTGAASQTEGKVMAAEGGTLFLDEIGDIDLVLQPKILRLLEEKKYERLGGTETFSADIRFIAATNKDLTRMVSRGRFREDLYYRLKVISIYLPPLRQRREDIPAIVNHFIEKYEAIYKKEVKGVTRKALGFLSKHDWPGNVRELENVIERAIVLTDNSRIRIDDVKSQLWETEISRVRGKVETGKLYEVEKRLILEALEKCDWNQSRASELLGVTRKVLRTRIARYNLSRPRRC